MAGSFSSVKFGGRDDGDGVVDAEEGGSLPGEDVWCGGVGAMVPHRPLGWFLLAVC